MDLRSGDPERLIRSSAGLRLAESPRSWARQEVTVFSCVDGGLSADFLSSKDSSMLTIVYLPAKRSASFTELPTGLPNRLSESKVGLEYIFLLAV